VGIYGHVPYLCCYQIHKFGGAGGDALQNGRVSVGADVEFLRETKRAHFLFSGDLVIKSLISDIYKKSVELHCLQQEEKSVSGEALRNNIEKQRIIKDWFESSLSGLEAMFDEYIKLKH